MCLVKFKPSTASICHDSNKHSAARLFIIVPSEVLSVSECYQVTAGGVSRCPLAQCHSNTGSVLIATLAPSNPATMSWRFKASKYKNAAPIGPKNEFVIRDLSIGSYNTGQCRVSSSTFSAPAHI